MALGLLALAALVTLLIGGALAWFHSLGIPDIQGIAEYHPPATVLVHDRHGRLLKGIFQQNREPVRLRDLPPHLPAAFVAAEDSGFWQHPGLDVWSILRAAANNLRSGRKGQGGSTITQQVTRGLLLSPEKSYVRKFKEAVLAYRIDRAFSKMAILQIYLNEIYLGEGAYGVGAAARVYFGKPATRLSLGECAMLAGLPQSPARYSPKKHLELARGRQRYVLNRMAEDGLVSDEEARQAWERVPMLMPSQDQADPNGYFLEHVRKELEQRFGREHLYRGGFKVWTTLDPALQRLAADSVSRGLAGLEQEDRGQNPIQAALVAIESDSGRIRALIGGRNFLSSPFNRAGEGRRQPGSAFKPIIYAAALERGLGVDHVIDDAPLQLRLAGGKSWQPQNFDNSFKGPTTLREGLIQSRNIVAIKLLKHIGFDPVLQLAPRMGIRSPLKRELSLALGSCELSPLELTGAYTVFAGGGVFRPPRAIERIQGPAGAIALPATPAQRVLHQETSAVMDELLHGVVQRGTGKAAALPQRTAGKTGTTDEAGDVWFVGYAGNLTTGIWLGHDRREPLQKNASGGATAAPIWRDFMHQAIR